jgi:hypothetical protein
VKSKLVIALVLFISIFIFFNRYHTWQNTTFFWDKMGYHSYLPATFIYHDVDNMSFYPEISHKYHWADNIEQYALHKQPNGKFLNKYPVGYSIMEMPFFLLAQMYTNNTNKAEVDGFSEAYQVANAFATFFWVITGLILLRKFLQKRFDDNIVAITLLCIALGTNLYYYTAFDHGMSHPFSFSIFCLLLFATDKYYRTLRPFFLYLTAFSLGFIFMLRQVNMLVALIPLLWGIDSMNMFKLRVLHYWQSRKYAIIAITVFCITIFIQLFYWKYITGHWLYYSYEGEGFNFSRLRVFEGLFSYQKGWFLYTPMALIAILGIFTLKKKYALPYTIYFTLAVYITFSWKEWWYGGSFGCRPLIETYALLSFPLASLITYIYKKNRTIKVLWFLIMLLIFCLNIFQSYQYSHGLIHYQSMTKERYWKVFGEISGNGDLDKYNLPGEYLNKEKGVP